VRKKVRDVKAHRESTGSFLVEFLVAFIVLTIIATTLFRISADSLRYLSTTRNDLYVTEAFDQVTEQCLLHGYRGLVAHAGKQYILYLTDSAQLGPAEFRERPLMLNITEKIWQAQSVSTVKLKDANTQADLRFTVDISQPISSALDDSITVIISAAWTDSYGTHKRSQSLILYDDKLDDDDS